MLSEAPEEPGKVAGDRMAGAKKEKGRAGGKKEKGKVQEKEEHAEEDQPDDDQVSFGV